MNTTAVSSLPAANRLSDPATPVASNFSTADRVVPTEAGARITAAPASPKKKRSFTPRRLALLVLCLGLGLGGAKIGYSWWTVGRFSVTTDDAYVGGEVTVIAPKVTSLVERVLVTDSQVVRAGDLLVKLDDRDFAAALVRANAQVSAAEAALANVEATRTLQNALIAQAEAGITGAEAEIFRAREEWIRFKQLTEKSAEPLQSYERAEATFKTAVAEGEKARSAAQAARSRIGVIDTEKQRAQAALAQAVAERDLAQLNLSYTEVRAPIDGVVGNRSVRVGAFAPVGAQLMALVPTQGLWVDANFKETQLARLQPGQPVEIEVDSSPDHVFRGRVNSLSPASGAQFSLLPAENATGNFTKIVQRVPVRIALDAEGAVLGKLRPGLSVTVKVDERTSIAAPRS